MQEIITKCNNCGQKETDTIKLNHFYSFNSDIDFDLCDVCLKKISSTFKYQIKEE